MVETRRGECQRLSSTLYGPLDAYREREHVWEEPRERMARSASQHAPQTSPRASTVLPRPARNTRKVITPSPTRKGRPGSRPFDQAYSRNHPRWLIRTRASSLDCWLSSCPRKTLRRSRSLRLTLHAWVSSGNCAAQGNRRKTLKVYGIDMRSYAGPLRRLDTISRRHFRVTKSLYDAATHPKRSDKLHDESWCSPPGHGRLPTLTVRLPGPNKNCLKGAANAGTLVRG